MEWTTRHKWNRIQLVAFAPKSFSRFQAINAEETEYFSVFSNGTLYRGQDDYPETESKLHNHCGL